MRQIEATAQMNAEGHACSMRQEGRGQPASRGHRDSRESFPCQQLRRTTGNKGLLFFLLQIEVPSGDEEAES